MPPIAAMSPSLKFSVGFMSLDLYANNRAANIPKVRKTKAISFPKTLVKFNYQPIP